MADKNPHSGHRARVFERVEKDGFDSLAEHEMLEYLLFFGRPRIDTNALAHALIDRFGGFSQVLDASEEELCSVPGVGAHTARLLRSFVPAYHYYARSKQKRVRFLKSTDAVLDYFRGVFAGETHEILYMAALDDRGRLIRLIRLGGGLANTVEVSRAQVVAEAVVAKATGVILAHNHPGGFAEVSEADLVSTVAIMNSLLTVNIPVLDHVIVAGSGDAISMRRQHRLPEYNPATGEVRYSL